MNTATISALKKELKLRNDGELIDLCLAMARFKKENKELLTYLLFEATDEEAYIASVQQEMTEAFDKINRANYYLVKKGIRKILRITKKYIRYSKKKTTEAELLIHFCKELRAMTPPMSRSVTIQNLYDRQIALIHKAIDTLHEDLQYDYQLMMEEVGLFNPD